MAIDRDTIIYLHNKGESNSTIATKLHNRCETVWKVVKKITKLVQHVIVRPRQKTECSAPVTNQKRAGEVTTEPSKFR